MDSSMTTCPFCDSPVPSSHLQWHAKSHFDDQDDLLHQFYLPPDLPLHSLPSEQAASGSEFGATFGVSNYWCDGGTSRECTMDDKISCLIALQTRSKFYRVEVGLMAWLRNCLGSESENSKTILSGHVDHFQSLESEDAGWGCGWRNIQMLCSHLLVQRPEAREVLFGGSGFVPDIPSLQRWLEIAWEKGFDAPGSAQFDHVIYGSKKWIGTTECAALLHFFGLWARAVDFGPKESESRYLSVPGSSADDTMDKASRHKMVKSNATKNNAYRVFMDFVWNYFSDESSIKFGRQHVVISEKT